MHQLEIRNPEVSCEFSQAGSQVTQVNHNLPMLLKMIITLAFEFSTVHLALQEYFSAHVMLNCAQTQCILCARLALHCCHHIPRAPQCNICNLHMILPSSWHRVQSKMLQFVMIPLLTIKHKTKQDHMEITKKGNLPQRNQSVYWVIYPMWYIAWVCVFINKPYSKIATSKFLH